MKNKRIIGMWMLALIVLVSFSVVAIDSDGDGYYDSKDFEAALTALSDAPGKVVSGAQCVDTNSPLQITHNLGKKPSVATAWISNSWEGASCSGAGCVNAGINIIDWSLIGVSLTFGNDAYCHFSNVNWKAGVFEPDCDDARADIHPNVQQETCGTNELHDCKNRDYVFSEIASTTPLLGDTYWGKSSAIHNDVCPSGSVVTGFKYYPRVLSDWKYIRNIWPRCTKLKIDKNNLVFGDSDYLTLPESTALDALCPKDSVVVGVKTYSDKKIGPGILGFAPICQLLQYDSTTKQFSVIGQQTDLTLKYGFSDPPNTKTTCPANSVVTAARIKTWENNGYLQSFTLTCSQPKFHPAEKTYEQVCPSCTALPASSFGSDVVAGQTRILASHINNLCTSLKETELKLSLTQTTCAVNAGSRIYADDFIKIWNGIETVYSKTKLSVNWGGISKPSKDTRILAAQMNKMRSELNRARIGLCS